MTDKAIAPRPQPMLGLVIAATGFAFLLVQLDVSIVNVALPAIGQGLGATIDGLAWIVDAYTLAFAALLLFAGTLGDRIGARRVFLAGFALFILASAACGFATGLAGLIPARVAQGAGAAFMVPSSLALLNHACGGESGARARAVGLWTAAGGIGLAAGPLLGGLLVEAFGWRSIFLVNVPVGIAGFLLTLLHVREAARRAGGFDPLGQMLGIVTLVALVGATIEAGPRGWLSALPLAGLALAVVAGAAFLYAEARQRDPMLPLAFFRDRLFSTATVVGLSINLTLYGVLFVLSLYLQHERGFSAAQAGRAFLPFTVVLGLANIAAGRAAARVGTQALMLGGLGVAAASYLALSLIGGAHPDLMLHLGLLGAALGIGTAVPAMTSTLLSRVPAGRGGLASGVLNTVRPAGGALGVALFGAMLAADRHDGVRLALLVSAGLVVAAALAVALLGRGRERA